MIRPMAHRVFLGINIPLTVKKVIENQISELKQNLPAGIRFLHKDTWHITVSFLGNQADENLVKISDISQKIAADFAPIEASFEKMAYGPSDANARMIWLLTSYETSSRIEAIKQMIENKLIGEGINLKRETRRFNGHVTLARFEKDSGLSNLPNLKENLNIGFLARSLDLMESELKPKGAEYTTIGKFEFFY